MSRWIWIAAAVLLAVAAGATWFAFQRPDFVAGLTAFAIAAAWKAFAPAFLKIFAPAGKKELAKIKKADDRGNERDRYNKGSGRPFNRPPEH